MVKTNKTWVPMTLEGPIISGDLDGLIGIEELTDYDLSTVVKGTSKFKRGTKRKSIELQEETKKKTKKSALNFEVTEETTEPGAFVRNPNSPKKNSETQKTVNDTENVEDSSVSKKKRKKKSKKKKTNAITNEEMKNNEIEVESEEKTYQKGKKNTENDPEIAENSAEIKATNKKSKKKSNKKVKTKTEIGVRASTENEEKITIEDLKAWDLVSLPTPILQALADLRFTKPTPIQELTLPPAMLGRRDILGAAETGSGKTLAFGLPILAGILGIKEKEKLENGDNVVEIGNGKSEDNDIDDDGEDKGGESDEEGSVDEDKGEESGDESDIDEDGNQEENQDSDTSFEDSAEEFEEEENEKNLVHVSKPTGVRKPLYALVLTPTRELAVQVKNHLEAIGRNIEIRVAVVLGGMAAVKQERLLAKGPEIVVATPGRLWELIQQGNEHLAQVDNIRYLAIDETDRMLERGHFAELHQLLERLNMNEKKRQQRQNFVFSATLTLVHDLPAHLIAKKKVKGKKSHKIAKLTPQQKLAKIVEMLGITDPKIVDVTREQGTAENLTECRITCPIEEKDFYVYYFLNRHKGRTLIFCNSIGCVKRLAHLLGLLGCGALPLHACMQQRQRLKNLERFRDDPCGVLVSTDVAARGLDIPGVEHVLHYQTPRTVESYVHRSGRTARALQQGIAVLLIEPAEIADYRRLCHTLNRTEDLPAFPIEERFLKAVKERVKIARELDKLELKTKRENSETGWLQKAAHDMDMIIDELEDSDGEDEKESQKVKREAALKRKQLAAILAKPLVPHGGMSFKYPTFALAANIPFVQQEEKQVTAIEAMKNVMEKKVKVQKTRKLFKPKQSIAEKKAERKKEKESEKRKKRKIKKDKLMKSFEDD